MEDLMITSTTPTLEGYRIVKYVGVVHYVMEGVTINFTDWGRLFFYEVKEQIKNETFNAIIDIHFVHSGTYQTNDYNDKLPNVVMYGTAVVVEKIQ